MDGTGFCQNEEDGKTFTCLVVPGSIISCPSKVASANVECIWISDIQANQSQFWCDKEDEMNMYGITSDTAGVREQKEAVPANKLESAPTDELADPFIQTF